MYKGKKILAITLARGGSKSIPKKNIADVNGKFLIQYTLEEVAKCSYIDKYVVSTDDKNIKKIVENLGFDCPFLRPPDLSSDTATSADALIHAVEFEQSQGKNFDYIVEVMVTNPLKTVEDINGCIKMAIDGGEDACAAVNQIFDQHPARVKYIEDGYLKPFYPERPESRRQDLTPSAFIRSGSVYVTKTSFLLKNRSRYSSDSTRAYIIPNKRVINIDEPSDLENARNRLK